MKKVFIIVVLAFTSVSVCFAQGKFAANFTNTGNLLTFKIRPDVTTTTGFSTVEFFIRYPNPSPAFTYGAVTVNTAAFPNMAGNGTNGGGVAGSGAWEIESDNPAYTLAGFHVDHFIYTAPAIITTTASYTGGIEYTVLSVQLLGTPPNNVDLQFVSDDQEATYYLAITDQNGADLRPAAITSYFYPSSATTPGPNGASIYFLQLLNVPLPVKFLNFSATKNNNSAILNWSVENENTLTDRYEIERSSNGVSFEKIVTISALSNGRSGNTYSYIQQNLSSIKNSGVIYFRIKQIDKDGKFVYTDIKNIRLNTKGILVGVYPNPIKQNTTLSFDLVENSRVNYSITDAAGKMIEAYQVQGFKGSNIKTLNLGKYAAGAYTLKVQAGDEIITLPLVKATN